MKRLFSFYCIAVLSALLPAPLSAQEPLVSSILARARATVGTEHALNGLITLQMAGELEPVDPKMPAAKLRIVARKPCSQRMEIKVDDIVETTLMSGGAGYMVRSNLAEHASQMRPLSKPELDRVAFSTRQFFSFYSPDFKNGERVTYGGVETRRGVRCHKLVYAFPAGLTTIRYFAVDTDVLVSTITENGVETVPVGLQRVEGIRFPERLQHYADGKKIHTLVFSTFIVNKPLPEGIFNPPKEKQN
jgi:hypothetical protein